MCIIMGLHQQCETVKAEDLNDKILTILDGGRDPYIRTDYWNQRIVCITPIEGGAKFIIIYEDVPEPVNIPNFECKLNCRCGDK